jgi:hypothetical protein
MFAIRSLKVAGLQEDPRLGYSYALLTG